MGLSVCGRGTLLLAGAVHVGQAGGVHISGTTMEAGALRMHRDYINTRNLATFGSKNNVNAPRWESLRDRVRLLFARNYSKREYFWQCGRKCELELARKRVCVCVHVHVY